MFQRANYGNGNNDIMATTTNITTGVVVRSSSWMDIIDARLITLMLCATDANGSYTAGGAGGVTGTWKIEVNNSYPSNGQQAGFGQAIDALNPNGVPVDVTADFLREGVGAKWGAPMRGDAAPTTGIPAAAGSGQAYPVTLVDCGFRQLRVSFTPTGGQGAGQRVACFMVAK
jgi:hypothetical protein